MSPLKSGHNLSPKETIYTNEISENNEVKQIISPTQKYFLK